MDKDVEKRIKQFFSKHTNIIYKKGESLVRAEDDPQGIYFLRKGYVRMYLLTAEGAELSLNIFKPGNPFPLSWAMGEIPNEYFYEAMTDCEVYRSPVPDFLEFIKADKEILFELGKNLAYGLDSILRRLQYLTMGNSHTKVVNIFLLLGRRLGEPKNDGMIIKVPMTHQDIANLTGLTRETVGLELKSLKKNRLILKRGKLYFLADTDKLQEEAVVNKTLPNN